MVKYPFIYKFILLLLFSISNQTSAQLTKNNLSASVGLTFPYSPNLYSGISFISSIEYLKMIDLSNGVTFQLDYTKFRTKTRLLITEIRSIHLGFRHRFTEKLYSQFSLGTSLVGQSSFSEFEGSAELRTGFIFPLYRQSSLDVSLLVAQTTKEFGWIGLKAGIMHSFKKKIKTK